MVLFCYSVRYVTFGVSPPPKASGDGRDALDPHCSACVLLVYRLARV
jgi:hypothetical protein